MNCQECQELISDYVDGEMELGAQTKIEQHLANCEPCRAVRDDLLQIVHFSRQLPLHTPSAAIWTRIQEQLQEEEPKTLRARLRLWLSRVQMRDFSLSMPQMAVVAMAFVVVAVISAVVFRNAQTATPQTPAAQNLMQGTETLLSQAEREDFQQLEQRINELKGAVEQQKSLWSADLRLSFDKNMIYVDQLLAECRQEVSNNPRDESCKELLRNAYKEKMRVLEGFVNF